MVYQGNAMHIFDHVRCTHFVLVLLFLASSFEAFSQNGLPFMTDIELSRNYSDSRISSITQDGEESMYFATSRGLLQFDGAEWNRIHTPSPAIRVYCHETSNRIFVGMKSGVVEISKTDSGTFEMVQIPGILSDQPFSSIIGTEKDIYFIAENEIYRLGAFETEPAKQYKFPEVLISGAFSHKDRLYLLFFQDGLFRWSEENLEAVGQYRSITEDQMLFSFETEFGTYIGFESDLLFRFDGSKLNAAENELQNFLSDNLLSDGLLLNDSLMALSTLAGGAVVADIKNQEIEYRFDYSTGAKDNEIFSLGRDRGNGLWLAYEQGLTRVDLLQPVRSFSGYPGLEGNLTTSLMVNGKLHVGTGNGVFVLKKATDKAEMKRMMENMIRKRRESEKQETASYVPSAEQVQDRAEKTKTAKLVERFKESPKEVKEELSKKEVRELKKELRRQRKAKRQNKTVGEAIEDFFTGGSTDDATDSEENESDADHTFEDDSDTGKDKKDNSLLEARRSTPQNAEQAAAIATVQTPEQQIKALRKSFIFKKVDGIDVKCRQLIQLGNEVFAATNNGLYQISGTTSENLTPGTYINYVAKSADKTKLLLATLDGVYEMSKTSFGKWLAQPINDSLQFVAYNVVDDNENNSIWAGTDNGVYRYSEDEVTFYPVNEVVNERVLVTKISGKIHLLLPNSTFQYSSESDSILPVSLPELPVSDRMDHVLGSDGIVWVRSSFGWNVLNGQTFEPVLPYLDLFEDIRHLSTDENGNIYIIDKGQNIYSLEHNDSVNPNSFNVYIKQAKSASGKPFAIGDMKIKTDGNELTFLVSAPFYLKSEGTQYQWRIEGLRDSWQRWSDNPEINPGIIPAGDYVLQVRARNILGEVSEVKTLAFSVPKPWYFSWYSFTFYVLTLVLGVWGLVKYREQSLRETQRILEAKVAERTTELEHEKAKTEELLLNILPKDTAAELQKNGKATARHYNQVSVLFTDFKGFTSFAENTPPEKLVDELHRYFVKFDEIIGKYYLEKIKTIGDAYMCAGGVPIRNNSNAIAITLAALEICDHMAQVAEQKRASGELALEIRIGIHTGPLTAGVVGMKKFAYDIWGDTVNTASRMESASEPGKINISGATHELIKKYFETEYRGQKQAKGKGLVEMHFVTGIKPEFSENGDGVSPNSGLLELIS